MTDAQLRSQINRRAAVCWLVGGGLTVAFVLLRGSEWQGNGHLHTLMEALATLLALLVGTLALVRYYSRKNNTFLFIGAGFIGTAFLDGYHTLVTSEFFAAYLPSDLPALIPWSWVASRFFLSVLLALSWYAWTRERKYGAAGRVSEGAVYGVTALLTIVSILFFAFAPLPPAYYPEMTFHRPEEFVPAAFFLVALLGYLRKGDWRTDPFEFWLVLALIVSFVGQTVFMSFSGTLFDMEFDVAHMLKKVSYVFVLTGLVISMYSIFRREEESAATLARANQELQRGAKERKHAEEALRDRERRLRSITANVPGTVYRCVLGADGTITFPYVSSGIRSTAGIGANEMVADPENFLRLIEPEDRQAWSVARAHSARQLEPLDVEMRIVTPTGETKWLTAMGLPRRGADGEIVWDGIMLDITQRKETEGALESANSQAETHNLAKSEFLASMSHEIRTPMNGILGMTRVLLETDLTTQQRSFAETIKQSSDALLSLLNDILDLSKIEAGQIVIEEVDFDLNRTLDEVTALWRSRAEEKGLSFSIEMLDGPPPPFKGDPARIRQILFNLVGNAIKFTEQGSIRLRTGHSLDEDGVFELRFEVADTGVGVPLEAQGTLFDKFTQADSSTTRKFGGSGLGLALCKNFVAALGGEIGLESEPGVGSTFRFTVRCRPGVMPEEPEDLGSDSLRDHARIIGGLRLKILVAEDVHVNQVVVRAMLSGSGHEIDIVENGLAAVESVRRGGYDLVLMDIQMPEMDGMRATRAIRNLPGGAGTLPIIAMTANAMAGDREKYLEAGMDDYVCKPVDPHELFGAMRRCLGSKIAEREMPKPPEPAAAEPSDKGREALDSLLDSMDKIA